MNIGAPFKYGQIATPSESPQSSVAMSSTGLYPGLSGVGQASTAYVQTNTGFTSTYAPFAAPTASDPSFVLAQINGVMQHGTTPFTDYARTPEQAGKFQ